jgi:hypothetical protein
VGLIAAGLLVFIPASCSVHPDPGNRRLRALQHDPVRDFVYPGATLLDETRLEGRAGNPGNQEQRSPVVAREYSLPDSEVTIDEIVKWYSEKLRTLGWQPDIVGTQATHTFHKKIDDWCGRMSISKSSSIPPETLEVRLTASDSC